MSDICEPFVFVRKTRPLASKVFPTYWHFASERQRVFFARLEDRPKPWTRDPIIATYKFTNAYRASDRVSQYLISQVLYGGRWSLRDTVLRTLLFKIFNKIETWEALEGVFGVISETTFDVTAYSAVLEQLRQGGQSIYSAAYIVPSGAGPQYKGVRKHDFHLSLIDGLIREGFAERLHDCRTMEDAYGVLLSVESFGKFLAYQFITDLNYSEHFDYSEMEFVVPGPGARDGIRKCFVSLGDYSEADVIRMMTDEQERHFDLLKCDFQSLWGRPLQLIDCQNLFCEVDKYSRVAHPDVAGLSGRSKIKQKFAPLPAPTTAWYPPKWGINQNRKSEG